MEIPLFTTSLEPYRERVDERVAAVTRSGGYILGPELAGGKAPA